MPLRTLLRPYNVFSVHTFRNVATSSKRQGEYITAGVSMLQYILYCIRHLAQFTVSKQLLPYENTNFLENTQDIKPDKHRFSDQWTSFESTCQTIKGMQWKQVMAILTTVYICKELKLSQSRERRSGDAANTKEKK